MRGASGHHASLPGSAHPYWEPLLGSGHRAPLGTAHPYQAPLGGSGYQTAPGTIGHPYWALCTWYQPAPRTSEQHQAASTIWH